MNISDRLKNVALMVTPGNIIADIGTDHGYVPMFLIIKNISPHALAMDINEGPLKRAEQNIRAAGLENDIELRLSDGMTELRPGEADTVVISGMGGELIADILGRADKCLRTVKELVISPHSFPEKARSVILKSGFLIRDEKMIREDGKYYVIINAQRGQEAPYGKAELAYGRVLLKKRDSLLKEYLERRYAKFEVIRGKIGRGSDKMSENTERRMAEISMDMEIISEALSYYN